MAHSLVAVGLRVSKAFFNAVTSSRLREASGASCLAALSGIFHELAFGAKTGADGSNVKHVLIGECAVGDTNVDVSVGVGVGHYRAIVDTGSSGVFGESVGEGRTAGLAPSGQRIRVIGKSALSHTSIIDLAPIPLRTHFDAVRIDSVCICWSRAVNHAKASEIVSKSNSTQRLAFIRYILSPVADRAGRFATT
jgi:hypothetical protein